MAFHSVATSFPALAGLCSGAHRSVRVVEVADIEENIWAPRYAVYDVEIGMGAGKEEENGQKHWHVGEG